jgi:hypothetical protein
MDDSPPPLSAAASTVTSPEHALLFRVARFDDLTPDLDQVQRVVGLQPGRTQHRRHVEQVEELAGILPRLARPRAVYRVDEVRRLDAGRLELASNAVFEGSLGRFLAHARLVATFIVTIGSAIERLSRGWLRNGQVMRGVTADALATEYAEAAARRCQNEIRAWALSQGLEITPRYSPGYCGLHVTQQVPLFASLPARRINVRLNASCLMVPLKSVSGLIGIGPAEQVGPTGYPCETCDHPQCMQRRAAFGGTRGGEFAPGPIA